MAATVTDLANKAKQTVMTKATPFRRAWAKVGSCYRLAEPPIARLLRHCNATGLTRRASLGLPYICRDS